jgi:glutamine cyclotransferase
VLRFHQLQVLRRVPHPGRGFTQGLLWADGMVWESTGLYGESAVLRYRLGLADPEYRVPLPPELFGEGICRVGGDLWQLTWQERVALRWQADTLDPAGSVPFNREGWGICSAGDQVLTSDGTSELVPRDPATLAPAGLIRVRLDGSRVDGLNDLDFSAGRVWANLAGRPFLAGIDPATGEVTDVVDAGAAWERIRGDPQAIGNGIAALPGPGEFLLTGKRWRFVYHVRLVPARPRKNPVRLLAG